MKLIFTKKLTVIILFLLFSNFSKAQVTYQFEVLGGAFNFSGPGASNVGTAKFDNDNSPKWIAEKPFGQKANFGFEVAVSATKVFGNKFLIGAVFGVQRYVNKTNFDSVVTEEVIRQIFPASGGTNLTNSYLNLQPFVGTRLSVGALLLDVAIGSDVALLLRSIEHGTIIGETGNSVKYQKQYRVPNVDIRPTLGLRFNAKKVGILVKYSKGITNYKNAYGQNAHSNFIGLGLSYALN